MQEHIETEKIMDCAPDAASLSIEKGITVQSVWKRCGNTADKVENFTEKIIYAVNAGKILCQMGKVRAQSAGQNVKILESLIQTNRRKCSERNKILFICIALNKEFVQDVGKEKLFQGRKNAAFVLQKTLKYIEKNMRIDQI